MAWKKNDRVKVALGHLSGLGGRLGTVLRVADSGYVEVDLDSWYNAGTGIVAFISADLVSTDKKPGWWKAREERRQRNPNYAARQAERAQTHHGRALG